MYVVEMSFNISMLMLFVNGYFCHFGPYLCSVFPPQPRTITHREDLSALIVYLKKDHPELYRLFLKRSQEDVSDSCNQQGHWTRLSPTFKLLNSHFTRATVGVEFVSRR